MKTGNNCRKSAKWLLATIVVGYITRNIDRYLSTGANFLLNVGSKADGIENGAAWDAGSFDRETLHVWGIPADSLANECIVLRLDFAPGVLDATALL